MNNLRHCNWCSKKLPEYELYFIEKNWISFDCACSACINQESKKIVTPVPLLTVEEYLFAKQNKPVTKTVDHSSTTRATEGFTTINNKDYEVVLEEETTVTRRIILNPKSSD